MKLVGSFKTLVNISGCPEDGGTRFLRNVSISGYPEDEDSRFLQNVG
jgi:hypothetical protein